MEIIQNGRGIDKMNRFLKRSYATILPAYELNDYLLQLDNTGIEWYNGSNPSNFEVEGFEDMMFMLVNVNENGGYLAYEVLSEYRDIERLGEVVEVVTPITFKELIK